MPVEGEVYTFNFRTEEDKVQIALGLRRAYCFIIQYLERPSSYYPVGTLVGTGPWKDIVQVSLASDCFINALTTLRKAIRTPGRLKRCIEHEGCIIHDTHIKQISDLRVIMYPSQAPSQAPLLIGFDVDGYQIFRENAWDLA